MLSKLVSSFLFSVGLVGILFIGGAIDSWYTIDGTVIDTTQGIVSIVDRDCEVWEYETGKLAVGDNVKIIMNNKATKTMTDDEIVFVRKVDR